MPDLTMNAMAMEFSDGQFDAAIDKGTLDSVLVTVSSILNSSTQCGENSVSNAEKMISEVSRYSRTAFFSAG